MMYMNRHSQVNFSSEYEKFAINSLERFINTEITRAYNVAKAKSSQRTGQEEISSSCSVPDLYSTVQGISSVVYSLLAAAPTAAFCKLLVETTSAAIFSKEGLLQESGEPATVRAIDQAPAVLAQTFLLTQLQAMLCLHFSPAEASGLLLRDTRMRLEVLLSSKVEELLARLDINAPVSNGQSSETSRDKVDQVLSEAINRAAEHTSSDQFIAFWKSTLGSADSPRAHSALRNQILKIDLARELKCRNELQMKEEAIQSAQIQLEQATEPNFGFFTARSRPLLSKVEFKEENGSEFFPSCMNLETIGQAEAITITAQKPETPSSNQLDTPSASGTNLANRDENGASRIQSFLKNFIRGNMPKPTPKPSELKLEKQMSKASSNKSVIELKAAKSMSINGVPNFSRRNMSTMVTNKIVNKPQNPKSKASGQAQSGSTSLAGYKHTQSAPFVMCFDDLEAIDEYKYDCYDSPHKDSTQSGSAWPLLQPTIGHQPTLLPIPRRKGTMSDSKENFASNKKSGIKIRELVSPRQKSPIPQVLFKQIVVQNRDKSPLALSISKCRDILGNRPSSAKKADLNACKRPAKESVFERMIQWDSEVVAFGTPMKEEGLQYCCGEEHTPARLYLLNKLNI